ncbi:MAG: helix-turn-helix transcriptional regulator [Peptoniphilaceae bacterium]|nr:helix-turn-helix transcriptional regulator [Peptoniphilaceae bacterium]MDY6085855.1 helix-turn-helix transcriptional regulator [Peptoniphilaceae bacterium]
MDDNNQKKIFSKNLRRMVSEKDKTQAQIASDIGVSPQTFNTWIRGVAMPRMGKIQKLADYFGVKKSSLIEERSSNSEVVILYQDDDYTLTSGTRRMKDGATDFLHGTLDTMTEPRDDDYSSSTPSVPSRDEIFDWLNTYWLMAADDGTNIERYTDEELLDYYYAAREAYEEEMEKDR